MGLLFNSALIFHFSDTGDLAYLSGSYEFVMTVRYSGQHNYGPSK